MTWARVPCDVHSLGLGNDRWRKFTSPIFCAQSGDPTAATGPCVGATKLWNVNVTVFLKVVLQPFEPSEEFTLSALSTSRGFGFGIAIRRDESHSYGFCC